MYASINFSERINLLWKQQEPHLAKPKLKLSAFEYHNKNVDQMKLSEILNRTHKCRVEGKRCESKIHIENAGKVIDSR